MFWVGIVSAVISAIVFSLIESRFRFAQKLRSHIKVEKPALRFVVFIAMAVAIGVLSSFAGMAAFRIFGNELLQEIVNWAVLGAGMVFLLSDAPPQGK